MERIAGPENQAGVSVWSQMQHTLSLRRACGKTNNAVVMADSCVESTDSFVRGSKFRGCRLRAAKARLHAADLDTRLYLQTKYAKAMVEYEKEHPRPARRHKKERDPSQLKRPQSAYFFFLADYREAYKVSRSCRPQSGSPSNGTAPSAPSHNASKLHGILAAIGVCVPDIHTFWLTRQHKVGIFVSWLEQSTAFRPPSASLVSPPPPPPPRVPLSPQHTHIHNTTAWRD